MIYKTISDTEFARWVARSDNYKNNFSYEGANALQDYLAQLSDDIGENIEFDPIAWCCEYSEYADYNDFQHDTGYIKGNVVVDGYPNIRDLDELKEHTTVIEFNGGIIVQDF